MGILDLGTLNKIANLSSYNNDINALQRAVNRGTNLFNKDNAISGKTFANDGTITDNVSYYIAYIPVDVNISSQIAHKNGIKMAQCDVNKNIISGTIIGNNTSLTATLVNGCCYLLITGLLSNIDAQTVVYGTSATTSVAYSSKTSLNTKVLDGVLSVDNVGEINSHDKNLLDNTRWRLGICLDTSGNESTASGGAVSDWIQVNPLVFDKLNFKIRNGVTMNVNIHRVSLYDKRKKFISQTGSIVGWGDSYAPIQLTSDTRYVRFWLPTYNTTYGFEGLVKYACFPFDVMDFRLYSGGTKDNMITPDDLIPYFRFGGTVASPTLVASSDAGACMTTYIPVKPNTKYYVQTSANSRQGRFYGKNKEFVSIMANGNLMGNDNIIVTPYNAYFVVFSFMNTWWDKDDSEHFIGMIEADKWDGKVVGSKVAEDDKVIASKTSGGFPCGRNKILGIFGNYIAMSNFDGTKMRFSASGWDAKPYYVGSTSKAGGWAEYTLSTALEGYTSDHLGIAQVVFFQKSNGTALSGVGCLVFSVAKNGIWYCADVTDVSNLTFAVPNIWDLLGNKSWRIDGTASGNYKTDSNSKTRYKKYYPTDQASRHGQWMWHNGPVWCDGIGGQYSRGVLFGNYSDHSQYNPSPNCLYYTDNGEDIYVMYEFGATPRRYKAAGDDTIKTRTSSSNSYCAGDVVDVSDSTLFPSGSAFTSLTIKKRTTIVPSATVGDPTAKFEYGDAVAISSVSGTSFTVADASGFAVGDIVIFEGTATGGYAKLLTTNIDATTKVGDGPVFVITNISGSVLTIADIVGNPKNNLFCRHIHGVTEFGEGICIYTGEEYPESWFIYMNPDFRNVANGTNPNLAQWTTDTIHLNSSANAYQRALGIILRPDGKCVYIADSNFPITSKLTVRGKDIKMGNYGVMVFDLSDIDDNSTAITKIPAVNAGYALYYIGGILFYSDYRGKTYYSEDWGDNWKYICRDDTTKSMMIGFDKNRKRYYFNQTRGSQFVIEIK